MDKKHHAVRCAVYAIFIKDHKILLSNRKNTGWMDGYYGLPQGRLDRGESLKDALVREVKEEVGLTLDPSDISFYHVMHRNENKPGSIEYMDFYFKVEYWQGEPVNKEPEKCAALKWHDMDNLPPNILPNVKAAINCYKGRIIFSELG